MFWIAVRGALVASLVLTGLISVSVASTAPDAFVDDVQIQSPAGSCATPDECRNLNSPESTTPFFIGPKLDNANSYWVQVQLAASVYDSRREVFSGRLSPGVQVGTRFDQHGFFLNFELDRNFDFNQRVERLDVFHVGPGVEWLLFGGRMRSSLSTGLAILGSDTDVESRGKRGWYVDLRPLSVRTKIGKGAILEITPLSMDASIPVPNGLPLILFSHMTSLSVEWATERAQ